MSSRYLYLVRHGEATSKEQNPERPLTESGAKEVEQIAAWFTSTRLHVDEIRHSGKSRAQQTAKIFAQHLGLPELPAETPGLNPNDDVQPMADSLRRESKSLMLVGHLPFMGRLVGCLVVGDPEQTVAHFDAAGVVVLQRNDDRWSVVCALSPQLLGTTSQ
jgi:phosphohistidine phosphatase